MDNGPESSGKRTQFLHRMVALCDAIGKPIQLLYYPPYHSKYNPIERCWGILELHSNGTKLVDIETMVEWARSMTWKGMHPIVELSRKIYQKGVTLRSPTPRHRQYLRGGVDGRVRGRAQGNLYIAGYS